MAKPILRDKQVPCLLTPSFQLLCIGTKIFQDGPEYEARRKRSTFTPPNVTLKDVRDAVPKHLFERSTFWGLFYVFKHLAITYAFHLFATRIDGISQFLVGGSNDNLTRPLHSLISAFLWLTFWAWQGFAFAGDLVSR